MVINDIEYVELETAMLAKKKGFTKGFTPCDRFFNPIANYKFWTKDFWNQVKLPCPTQSELARWLRINHKIHIEVFLSSDSPYTGFYYRVMEIGKYFTTSHDGILSNRHENAMERGLIEALKLIEDEKI